MSHAERRFTNLLTTAVVATYVLLLFGAVVAARGEPAGSWPLLVPEVSIEAIAAIAHRTAAVVAGVALFPAALQAHRTKQPLAVRWLLFGAIAGFVGQVGIGAAVALGDTGWLTGLHLPLGVLTFLLLVGTLVQALHEQTADSAVTEQTAVADLSSPTIEPAKATAEERSPTTDTSVGSGIKTKAKAYVRLTKPRLLYLLCLLAAAGMGLAILAGSPPSGVEVVATLGAGVLAVGASGVANHVYERDRDQMMSRTEDRPLVQEHVSVRVATVFCVTLTVGSLTVALAFVSPLVAALIGAAIVYYAVVYTMILKPNTRWSTLLGGGSGALPAVIGWAAGTGSIGFPGLLLAAIVVLWTPAHFYNLAIAYREDYARGGFPLVPVVEGPNAARRRIVGYLAATLLAVGWLGAATDLGLLYAVAAIIGTAVFLSAVVVSFRDRSDDAALRAFYASNVFLGVLLVAIILEGLLALAGGVQL